MSYSPRVTDEEVADMLRLRKEGHTQKEIAEWVGCAERTVGYHLRLNGMPRQRIWIDTAVKQLLEIERQGISMTEIARQMGMTYKSVTMELFLLRKKLGAERVPKLPIGRPVTHLPAKYLKRGDLHRFTFFRIDSGLYEVTYRRSATLAYTARVSDMEMIRKTHLAKCAEKEDIRTLRDYVINYAKEHHRCGSTRRTTARGLTAS
jgi:DNA-binding CsgD family transcriptional regulator